MQRASLCFATLLWVCWGRGLGRPKDLEAAASARDSRNAAVGQGADAGDGRAAVEPFSPPELLQRRAVEDEHGASVGATRHAAVAEEAGGKEARLDGGGCGLRGCLAHLFAEQPPPPQHAVVAGGVDPPPLGGQRRDAASMPRGPRAEGPLGLLQPLAGPQRRRREPPDVQLSSHARSHQRAPCFGITKRLGLGEGLRCLAAIGIPSAVSRPSKSVDLHR